MGLDPITIGIGALIVSALGGGAAVVQKQVTSHKTASTLSDQSIQAGEQLQQTKQANAAATAEAQEKSSAIAAQEQTELSAAETAREEQITATAAAAKKTIDARKLALETTGRPSTFATGNAFGLRSDAPVKKKKLGQ